MQEHHDEECWKRHHGCAVHKIKELLGQREEALTNGSLVLWLLVCVTAIAVGSVVAMIAKPVPLLLGAIMVVCGAGGALFIGVDLAVRMVGNSTHEEKKQ